MNKMWKRASAILMAAMLCTPVLPARASSSEEWKDSAASGYSGGDGTKNTPFEISTPEELALFAKDSNEGKEEGKYYILTAEIDLAGKLWNSAGTDGDGLNKASFDGGGFAVKNMKVQGGDQAGFIAFNNASTVKNLGLVNADVTGRDHTGGLIGMAVDHGKTSNIIENCYVTGKVTGKNNVGGLIGNIHYDISMDSESPIRSCFSTADVSGSTNVGGLVGLSQNAEVMEGCFAAGSVTAASGRAGGFAGELQASRVENSFASGDVKGKTEAGGFAGQSKMGTLSGIYAAGKVTSDKAKGGVTASNAEPGSAYENTCFASDLTGAVQAVGNDKKLGKSLKGSDLLTDPAGKLGFPDFDDNWVILPKNGGSAFYPVPKALAAESPTDIQALVKEAVKTEAFAVKEIQIKGAAEMYSGQSMLLTVSFKPSNALPIPVKWEVKGDQAVIDKNGKITAKEPGDITVRASVEGKEEIYDECEIHIKPLNVHEVEKDIKKLPLKPSYGNRNQILSAVKAFNQLTEDEKKEVSSQDRERMQKSMSALSKLLKNKKDVSVSGSLSEGVEIFLEKTEKTDSIWSQISGQTEGYLFEAGHLYLYDHMSDQIVQPDGEVLIRLKADGDYRNESNIRIAVLKEDGTVMLLKPEKIEKNAVTFRTSIVNSYAIVGDAPKDLKVKKEKAKTTKAKGSGTGDESPLFFYLCMCAGAFVLLAVRRRKTI